MPGGGLVYRKLFTSLWADRKFRELTAPPPNAQTLWIYLLAGEHTDQIPGLARVGEAGLAEALGWSVEDLRRCWREIEAQGMAKADWNARVVWLPNAVRYNAPENPNVVTSWARAWVAIPECALKDEARAALLEHMKARGRGFVRAFEHACPASSAERFRKPSIERSEGGSANHEHEHEQDPLLAAADAAEDEWGRVLRYIAEHLRPSQGKRLREDLAAAVGTVRGDVAEIQPPDQFACERFASLHREPIVAAVREALGRSVEVRVLEAGGGARRTAAEGGR